ncbi:MAG: AAA domain-containing protein [Treponema sp.]|nr:AAA domain-containing protein [Treponema sp.]
MESFKIENKEFELIVTADNIISTDPRFTMSNLKLGNEYVPIDTYFEDASGKIIRRNYIKNEKRNSNQTMPRIACQVFEKHIDKLSVTEKENFPICKYGQNSEVICGIYSSVEEFKKHRNGIESMTYNYDNGRQFVFYCWSIFSTIVFVQECLKRFGKSGDKFVLLYQEKDNKEKNDDEENLNTDTKQESVRQQASTVNSILYKNPYSYKLIESKNIIFRGAPGTGKSYLSKVIASDIISNGRTDNYDELTAEEKKQVEFVQFHPSYDYSDFVEGLRPKLNDDGSMGFELRDGIFKSFVDSARKNFENLKKSLFDIKQEKSKKYVFIIDEINRGEISKIFGELFFAVDPGYRGKKGEVSTQYSNLHSDPNEKFYIPENVYIIGTMNDIDRSVESFDFAMRRRFRFIEIKVNENIQMLNELNEPLRTEAINRMTSLNNAIVEVDDLNENYQIGAAYFLKLETLEYDQLWTDYLEPLLKDYVQGMYDEKSIMEKLKKAYMDNALDKGTTNDDA